jgi:hypothetical protein
MKLSHCLLPALGLLICQLEAQSIVGSWVIKSAGEAKSDAVLTFLADGTYTMAEDGNSKLDPSGMDGMERGTYKWNPTTQAFSVKTLVDTTGEWGFSNAEFNTASISGTKLTIADNSGRFTLQKVTGSSKLVGSWYFKKANGYALCTFLSDGTYFHVEDGKAKGGGRRGMERGTSTWNPTTKVFTRKVLVDTNGTWGFSDDTDRKISISGNKLTMTVAGEGKFTLSRVIEPLDPKAAPGSATGQLLDTLLGRRRFGEKLCRDIEGSR